MGNIIDIQKETKHVKSSDKEFKKYLGYKFYKVDPDSDEVEIVRIVSLYKDKPNVLIKHEDGHISNINIEKLGKEYTPLTPKGFIMTAHVVTYDENKEACHDVIVSLYNYLDAKMGNNIPSAVCRQSINDFFYDLISNTENHGWVGVSVTPDNCPAQINYMYVLACDRVIRTDMVNFYLDDTIDDILDSFSTIPYDDVLNKLYVDHMKSINPMYTDGKNDKRTSDHGWCRSLKSLLIENNFISDIDSMRMVTSFNFDLKSFMTVVDEDVFEFDPIMIDFFNYIYKLNVTKTMVIKYGYDINMGEFQNSNYIFIRDSNNITWLCVYVNNGEYIEKDLEDEFNMLGVADKLRLSYYDKYHNSVHSK